MLMSTYYVKQSNNCNFEVINKFEEFEQELTSAKGLAERQNKRRSKISVHNKFHVKRWGR